MKLQLLSILLLLPALQGYHVTATGRIVCHGRGLPYSRITLMDDDWPVDKTMGTAVTNSQGYFTVSGSASDISIFNSKKRRPDLLIRMDYRYYSSYYGSFEVKRPLYKGKEKTSTLSDREGNVSFGTRYFNTEACRSYLSFYDAIKNFRTRVGYHLPFDLKVSTDVLVHGGTAYALYDDIKLPKGSFVSYETAKHELAHTLRHRYDGALSHFVYDAGRFVYTRTHYCSKSTNLGFAFNEGWAEFWAGSCLTGSATGSKIVEGNVASALRKLQSDCNSSDYRMWEVLRKNAGRIHSYSSYEHYHKSLYSCP